MTVAVVVESHYHLLCLNLIVSEVEFLIGPISIAKNFFST